MWRAVILFLCVSLLLLVVRAVLGPSVFDRILAVNVFGTNVVVLIAVVAVGYDSESFLDVALVYAFLNFIATIGYLQFFKKKQGK
jgi:multicomponent Na+:H+ antiporter subunit F